MIKEFQVEGKYGKFAGKIEININTPIPFQHVKTYILYKDVKEFSLIDKQTFVELNRVMWYANDSEKLLIEKLMQLAHGTSKEDIIEQLEKRGYI